MSLLISVDLPSMGGFIILKPEINIVVYLSYESSAPNACLTFQGIIELC